MEKSKFTRCIKTAMIMLVAIFSLYMARLIPVDLLFAKSNAPTDEITARSQGDNPLLEEMQTLDRAYRDLVSAVAIHDGKGVYKALTSMHGTQRKTREGIRSGVVKIPKNPKRVKEFVQMDKVFHADLDSLAIAAKKNDEKEMLAITKRLLDGCVNCHQRFRK
ncbi:MAG: cytochrome c [Nitrospirae bacterium]|nr:cytochrome c [Nitrospirota bacterium]